MVDRNDVSDPFVDVILGSAKLAKTRVICNDLNPEWNESYRIDVCHVSDELRFEVLDKDHAYAEMIGIVKLSTAELVECQVIEGWFPIQFHKAQNGELRLSVEYVPVANIDKSYEVRAVDKDFSFFLTFSPLT